LALFDFDFSDAFALIAGETLLSFFASFLLSLSYSDFSGGGNW
jgi:hypothetical protein